MKLCGILNGIDTDNYNPETDKDIWANYNADDFSNKAKNKAELQKMMGMNVDPDVPVVGIVTRLVGHKGVDLMKEVLEKSLYERNIQYVVLGSGEWEYENYFRYLHDKYPDKVGITIGFVPDLARKIYAGADLFLMPSKSEPCGLSQMVALRYGTLLSFVKQAALMTLSPTAATDRATDLHSKHTTHTICSALFTEVLTHITARIGTFLLNVRLNAI